MERKENLIRPTLLLITSMYLAGFIGLNIPVVAEYFKLFTPYHLIFNALILIYFHKAKNKNFYIFCFVVFLLGFLVEVLGVKTGKIFGVYQYGRGLGTSIFEVPIVIGANWLALIICSGIISWQLARKIIKPQNHFHIFITSIIAASLMTLLDLIIERVAPGFDFWSWKLNFIPLQNYVAWFVVAFVMEILFNVFDFKKENPIAVWLFVLQVLFFGGNLIIINWRV